MTLVETVTTLIAIGGIGLALYNKYRKPKKEDSEPQAIRAGAYRRLLNSERVWLHFAECH